MDKTETELVNKQLTNEMMQRQNEIMTRLLEAENAERERKQDEKENQRPRRNWNENCLHPCRSI